MRPVASSPALRPLARSPALRPVESLVARAATTGACGDRLLQSDPLRAGACYLRCAELLLASALLGLAREQAGSAPLRALALLGRCEELDVPAGPLRAVAARAYLALGELEVARAFYAACRAPAPRRAASPWRPTPDSERSAGGGVK